LETVPMNVYGSAELGEKPKFYSSTSERRLVSLNDSKANPKATESAYLNRDANEDQNNSKRRLTMTSLTELPS
ncbi:MAG: hypothetical protein ACKO96_43250, partial [Flammeovirgaceae bacterium]